jgi:hypothetical protein
VKVAIKSKIPVPRTSATPSTGGIRQQSSLSSSIPVATTTIPMRPSASLASVGASSLPPTSSPRSVFDYDDDHNRSRSESKVTSASSSSSPLITSSQYDPLVREMDAAEAKRRRQQDKLAEEMRSAERRFGTSSLPPSLSLPLSLSLTRPIVPTLSLLTRPITMVVCCGMGG